MKVFKKIISAVAFLGVLLVISSCGNSKALKSINLAYMDSLSMNLTGKKGLTIAKGSVDSSKVKLLSDDGSSNEKNMLYSTTDISDYDDDYICSEVKEQVSFKLYKSTNEEVKDENGNVVSVNSVITQDNINAQINKIYVTDKFTFMQFVAILDKSCADNIINDNGSGTYRYLDENGNTLKEYVE